MAHIDGRPSLAGKRMALAVMVLCLTHSAAAQTKSDQVPAGGQSFVDPYYRYPGGQQSGAPAGGRQPVPRYPGTNAPSEQYPYYQYPNPKYLPGQYRGTEQDQKACIGDVFRMCGNAIPDVSRIIGCLQSNRRILSPPCRAVFSRGHGTRRGRAGGN